MHTCHSPRKTEPRAVLRTCWPTSPSAPGGQGHPHSPKSLPHATASRHVAPGAKAGTLACPFGKVANAALARFSRSFLTCVLGEISAGGEIILCPTQGGCARAHTNGSQTRLRTALSMHHLPCFVLSTLHALFY